MTKYAWASLLATDDYLEGILGLNYSLQQVKTKYDFIVIALDTLSNKTFQKLADNNIQYKKVKRLSYQKIDNLHYYHLTLNKFYCYTLTEYKKVCFIDADILLLDNIDNKVFHKRDLCCGYYPQMREQRLATNETQINNFLYNGALITFKPNIKKFENILKKYLTDGDEETTLIKLKRFNKQTYNKEIYNCFYHNVTCDRIKYWFNIPQGIEKFYEGVKKMQHKAEQGFVTLLSSNNFLEAVLVLNRSLKKVKSKYPLIVACTPSVYNNPNIFSILVKEGCIPEKIEQLDYNQETKQILLRYNNPDLLNVASKIEVYSLAQYDKLCYLDADSFAVKNIDSLLKRKDGSILIEPITKLPFCALFVFKPRNHNISKYREIIARTISNDADLIENLHSFCLDNKKYFIPNKYFYIPRDEKIKRGTKCYHLSSLNLKYWKKNSISNKPIAKLYYSFLNELRKDYKKELNNIRV